MNIVVIGRRNVGRGLAAPWRTAGHEVTAIGRPGGDASDADVAEDGARDITEELITDAAMTRCRRAGWTRPAPWRS
jgi:predicted dinucleotide-binding enzyme